LSGRGVQFFAPPHCWSAGKGGGRGKSISYRGGTVSSPEKEKGAQKKGRPFQRPVNVARDATKEETGETAPLAGAERDRKKRVATLATHS